MRPGCDRPASARLAYDPVGLQLWLDPLGPRAAPVQELCEFHIERLTIPRGWSATDRRPGTVEIDSSLVSVQPIVVRPEVRPEPELETVPEPVPEPEVVPEPAPELEQAPEPEPRTELPPELVTAPAAAATDSPRRRRDPRRPAARKDESLLGRAFAWTGPQQSVLTQRNDPDDGPGDRHPDA
jgi:hypothetical protein